MSEELTGALLGALILKPELLEAADITAADIPDGPGRDVFLKIAELWEDGRPSEIDSVILAERLNGSASASFLAGLLNAPVRLEPETFRNRLGELRSKRLRALIGAEQRKIDAIESKTGTYDAEAWDKLFELHLKRRGLVSGGPRIRALSEIEPKEISWLWEGRIPFGMLSLIAGGPGLGKSILSVFLAARLSKGEPLPDTTERIQVETLFLCGEDPIDQAVRPRFDANGGDPARTSFMEIGGSGFDEIFPRLRQGVKERPKIRLVILDPLNVFLKGGADFFKDPDVRRNLLSPLSELAEETGVAVVGVVHPRKDSTGDALSRVAGSLAFVAAARSVLGVGVDPDDEDRRILGAIKCNYCKRPPSLGYNVGGDLVVRFDQLPVPHDVETIFTRRDPAEAADRSVAETWLRQALKDGPVDFKELRAAAEDAGILKDSLYRAQKKLGIIPEQSGFGKFRKSAWALPK